MHERVSVTTFHARGGNVECIEVHRWQKSGCTVQYCTWYYYALVIINGGSTPVQHSTTVRARSRMGIHYLVYNTTRLVQNTVEEGRCPVLTTNVLLTIELLTWYLQDYGIKSSIL